MTDTNKHDQSCDCGDCEQVLCATCGQFTWESHMEGCPAGEG